MSYDSKCFELADYFLQGEVEIYSPENRSDLAQRIQDTAETFISEKREPKKGGVDG